MLNEESPAGDGAVLARSVRALAVQARRTLSQPVSEKEVRGLLRTINRLERQLEARSSVDLSRWVDSLRRRAESELMTAV